MNDGQYLASPPDLSDGAVRPPLLDIKGRLQVVIAAGAALLGKLNITGAAKGATAASDVTVTSAGSDHNNLDVIARDASGNVLGVSGNPIYTAPTSRVARAAHLASAALSSSYSSQSAYSVPNGATHVAFYVTYTRGGASGQAKFKIMAGNGTDEGPLVVIDSSVTLSEPLGQQSMRGGEFLGPIPTDGSAITFVVPVQIRGGVTAVRLLAAESGNTGSPGTCAITLTAGYE